MKNKKNIFLRKKILIYGLGKSGISSYKFLKKKADVYLFDDNLKINKKILSSSELSKISFDEALKLFDLPIYLGDFEDHKIEANIGRYGPYVKFDKKFISIPGGKSPFEIDLDSLVDPNKSNEEEDLSKINSVGIAPPFGRF